MGGGSEAINKGGDGRARSTDSGYGRELWGRDKEKSWRSWQGEKQGSSDGGARSRGAREMVGTPRHERIMPEVSPDKHDQVVTNERPRGWELEYARKSYFPFWRSVLKSKSPVKVIPMVHFPTLEEIRKSREKSASQGSPRIQDFNLGVIERLKKFSNQHKRSFCSIAFPLLKVLKKA
ncbi:hypothetical protein PR202_gb13186 [Eleusine coracana subsp. coracana]|uniref:Uncharacterized protein n=1 Tax=Eleusine coracana subsp. coracana TaxID=191504 RepID=A0AAV5ET45_ELECO|nr:hypothetical protein PR202_gb13186 [Eleusine coracana subsp. coracana]